MAGVCDHSFGLFPPFRPNEGTLTPVVTAAGLCVADDSPPTYSSCLPTSTGGSGRLIRVAASRHGRALGGNFRWWPDIGLLQTEIAFVCANRISPADLLFGRSCQLLKPESSLPS